jgi:hypothetical protein
MEADIDRAVNCEDGSSGDKLPTMSSEPDPAKRGTGAVEERPRPARWRRIIDHWFWKVAGGGLLVTSVVYSVLNYRDTQHGNRPKLDPHPIGASLTLREGHVWRGDVDWRVRSMPPRSLFMKVYMADTDGRRQEKPWAECGPNSFINDDQFICGIDLGVLDHLPDHLLICATSFNENGNKDQQQPHWYRVHLPVQVQAPGPPGSGLVWKAQLKEEPLPREEVCR